MYWMVQVYLYQWYDTIVQCTISTISSTCTWNTHTQCRSRYSLDTETADSTYTNCIIHRRERFAYTHTQQIGLQLIQFTIICITICITICIMNCIWTISKLFKKNRVNIWTYLIMGGITHTQQTVSYTKIDDDLFSVHHHHEKKRCSRVSLYYNHREM